MLEGEFREVPIDSSLPNNVKFHLNLDLATYLVLSDTYYPGWTAKVNGIQTPILQANGAFRAIALKAGEASVEFSYFSPHLLAGIIISSLSVCLFLIFSLVFEMRKYTSKHVPNI